MNKDDAVLNPLDGIGMNARDTIPGTASVGGRGGEKEEDMNSLPTREIMIELLKLLRKQNEKNDENNTVVGIAAAGPDYESPVVSFFEKYFGFMNCFCGCLTYILNRYKKSTVMNFVEGFGVLNDDVDTTVNNLTLVQALLLTIPPGIITSLNGVTGVWESLKANIAACNIANTDSVWIDYVYNPIWRTLFGAITAGVSGILLAVVCECVS